MTSSREEIYGEYNEGYFDGNCPYGYGGYRDTWIWAPITEIVLKLLKSKRVLDFGCAKGFLVQRFVERGVDALGADVSHYAISQARPWVLSRLLHLTGPETSYADSHFDTVLSFETLEHLHEDDVLLTLREFHRISSEFFFGTIFLDTQHHPEDITYRMDPTHLTIRSREWWDSKFDEAGWFPRQDLCEEARGFPTFQQIKYEVFCYQKKET